MEYDAMSDALTHLNRAVDMLVVQNREREVTQNTILAAIAVLQNDVKRLTGFIDGERIVEKIARMEERLIDGAAHRVRIEEHIIGIDKEIEAIKNKILWGLIGGIGAIIAGIAQAIISKFHL